MSMQPSPMPPSLWAAITPERTPAAPLEGEAETDIAVVGGGFTGLSAALHLARRGEKVTLLEAEQAGWGASGRNNGQVIPTLTAAEPDAIVARHGDAGERLVRLIGESADYLFRTAADEKIDCEAEQNGWFQPAHSPGRVRLSEKRVEAWRRFGFPAELLDAEGAGRMLGSRFWYGGMFNPTGGHINPLALARGLAEACTRRGVTLHEATPVTGWERQGDRWRLTTPRGALRARAAILATNAYTLDVAEGLATDVVDRMARAVVPVRSWQMATAPLGDNLRATIIPGRQAVSDTSGDLRFFRYDARNRLVTGAAILGTHDAAARVQARASRRLAQAFPEIGEQRFEYVWNGYVGMTWDRFPVVHRLGSDLWAWTGCNGRGVALSISLGRELALAATGTRLDELALPLSEPRPLPMHRIARRVAPYYLAWLRRQDRREIALD
ncbi:MAG: FAD-binding oxidoreductase [Geminicoccaceae bacterium]|nr:FAD-binding oxidoreductase [Geminicoccaceae bacterium]